jgi:hypothetical protein
LVAIEAIIVKILYSHKKMNECEEYMILRKKMPMEKEKRKKNPKKSAHALQKKRWAGRGVRARKDRHNTGIVLHFNEGPPCLDNISIESAPFFFLGPTLDASPVGENENRTTPCALLSRG